MVLTDVVNGSFGFAGDLLTQVGKIGLFLQALGVIIILYVIFDIIAVIVNRKIRKTVYRIEDRLTRVEKKLDNLLERRK